METLLVLFAVLSSSLLESSFVDAANDNATIKVFNPLRAFQQCSNGDKKWHICRGTYRPFWYCSKILDFNSSQLEDIGPCFTCPDADSDSNCKKAVNNLLTTHNISKEAIYDDNWWGFGFYIANVLVSSCQELCEAGKMGDACSTGFYDDDYGVYHGDSCTPGSHVCDFASDEEFAMNVLGTCKVCPLDPNECYQDDFVTSMEGKQNCGHCMLDCSGEGTLHLTVSRKEIPNNPIDGAIQKSYQNASGPLIGCSNLLLESEDECPGAEGHVCIVDYSILRGYEVGKLDWQLSDVAEKSGRLTIISNRRSGFLDYDDLSIPIVFILEEDGNLWLKSDPSAMARVEVQMFGS